MGSYCCAGEEVRILWVGKRIMELLLNRIKPESVESRVVKQC